MTEHQPTTERRTKRRYAHELYPHPEEGQTRPLACNRTSDPPDTTGRTLGRMGPDRPPHPEGHSRRSTR